MPPMAPMELMAEHFFSETLPVGCTQVPPCGEIVLVLVNLSKQNFKRVCSFFYDKIASPMSSMGTMNAMGGMKFMTEIKAVSNKSEFLSAVHVRTGCELQTRITSTPLLLLG